MPALAPRPGETAFALAKCDDGSWRYLGVARQSAGEGAWTIPDVDHETWRTWRGVAQPTSHGPE